MTLTRVDVSHFRNIKQASFNPSQQINFIVGENGAGKTSLLEAISTLTLGRSFRTRVVKSIASRGSPKFTLYSEFSSGQTTHKLGVEKTIDGNSLFKLDGEVLKSSAILANYLPTQVINADSFQLLTSSPSERRQFLDWLVFHVKHSFQEYWQKYNQCLKQRNVVLKSATIDRLQLEYWDAELARYAVLVDNERKIVLSDLSDTFSSHCKACHFLEGFSISLEYKRGWPAEHDDYLEYLKSSRERDIRQGFTGYGPHKSDIKVMYRGVKAADVFSRGQLKSLALALYATQMDCFLRGNQSVCRLLVDDLPAELDENNLSLAFQWLSTIDRCQIFMTAVELNDVMRSGAIKTINNNKMFHVKHGQITEQTM